MILIAESGSTKCDCILLDLSGKEVDRFSTMGFNPYFHSTELIFNELSSLKALIPYAQGIAWVYFYGAGCSSPSLNAIVKKGLEKALPNATVSVEHDLMAAAFSTYRGKPQISCILGTGSNSVFFDGKELYEEVPALAYILGDEGSGSFLGKKLLAAFLYKKLPAELNRAFELEYSLDKNTVVDAVYNKPNANVWLASFSKFFGQHKNDSWVRAVVKEGFSLFRDIHILCYQNAKEVEINFVGSVAFHFKDILEEVLAEKDLHFGYVLERPLDGLVHYHLEFLKILERTSTKPSIKA